jgi:aspartate/methionine/tyrosine aminotransferase
MAELTHREQEAQLHHGNVADGHASQNLHPGFQPILGRLGEIWLRCENRRVADVERDFVNAFANLAQTPSLKSRSKTWIAPTASVSIDIAGAALASRCPRVALVTPTFDNLNQLCVRRGCKMVPISDRSLGRVQSTHDAVELLRPLHVNALFMVFPNNPTGLSWNSAQFRAIAEACKNLKMTLVVDRTFRFFEREFFDDYAVLDEVGVSHIVIEDTGKTWSTLELKTSLIVTSRDWVDLVDVIYSEIFLSSSSLAVAIHTEFLTRTAEIGLDAAIWSAVDSRRLRLRRVLDGTALKAAPTAGNSWLSVEWLDCSATGLDDRACEALGKERGVWMLPGRFFFWDDPDAPAAKHYLRIALLKREDVFSAALRGLQSAFGSGRLRPEEGVAA